MADFRQLAKQMGYSDEEIRAVLSAPSQPQAPAAAPVADPEKNVLDTVVDWLPTIGSTAGGILGGLGGSFVAPGAGTIAGGVGGAGAGGAAGEWLQQKIRGEQTDMGEIAKEGALGAGGQLVGGVVGKVAGKVVAPVLKNVADDFAIKGLRLKPSQLSNFMTRHGEDVSETLARHGLQGSSADDIALKGIKPLQEAYNQIAKNTDVVIPQSQLDDVVLHKVTPLLNSAVEEDQVLAEKILSSYDFALKNLGDKPLTMAQANSVRQAFDSQVKNWGADVMVAGKNRVLGQAFREAMQEAADAAGATGPAGQSFKEVGKELSKLYDIEDMAQLQAQLGRGSLPVGLTTLLGWGAGGPMGGVAGGAAAAAATNVLNRTGTSRLISRMAGRGSQVANQLLQGPVSQTLVGQGLTRGTAGLSSTAQAGALPEVGQDPMTLADMQTSTLPDIPQAGGISPAQLNQIIAMDLMETGGKNITQIQAIAKLVGGDKPKELTATQKEKQQRAQNGLNTLNRIEQQVTNVSKASRVNPFDQGGRKLEADIKSMIDQITYLRTGAAATKEQLEIYRNLLPTLMDSPETAQAKLARLREELTMYLNQTPSAPDVVQQGEGLPDINQLLGGY